MGLSRLFPEMSPALKRYYLRSVLPCLAFLLLTLLHASLLEAAQGDSPWRAVVALLPLAPWFWILYEYARFLRECDELERRIELNALVAGTAIGTSTAMTLLFLLDAHVISIDAETVAALTASVPIAAFALARHVLHRRYR